MLTNDELNAIRARWKSATPGGWALYPELCGPDGQGIYQEESMGPIVDVSDPYPRGDNHPQENMEFIVSAHNDDIPALLEEVDRLRRENAFLRAPDIKRITHEMICAYLERAGWLFERQHEPNADMPGAMVQIWKAPMGKPAFPRVWVPLTERFGDYYACLDRAIRCVAGYERRTAQAVMADVLAGDSSVRSD